MRLAASERAGGRANTHTGNSFSFNAKSHALACESWLALEERKAFPFGGRIFKVFQTQAQPSVVVVVVVRVVVGKKG